MERFSFWAQPWWVNLLILIPPTAFWLCRTKGLPLPRRQLLWLALFAVAFGFVEAAVVIYLRAATGLLPGYHGTLADVQRAAPEFYQQAQTLRDFPQSLLTVEVCREAATILMLITVALLAASTVRARGAAFLWAFAIWDITYYAGLWLAVRWPASFKDLDVLFLIPVPWMAPVWFPILVSVLTIAAVILSAARRSA